MGDPAAAASPVTATPSGCPYPEPTPPPVPHSRTPPTVKGAEDWPPFLPPEKLLRLEGEQRREAGRKHFQAVIELLLAPLSAPLLSELADWACNEPGCLHTSQISHLRNGKKVMLGNKAVEALGRINQAAWVARNRPWLLERLGTAPLSERIEGLVRRTYPLLHPISGHPLGPGDFLAIYMGSLRLPEAEEAALSAEQAQQLALRLGPWLDQALLERGLSLRMAWETLQELCPGDGELVGRLLRVVAGFEECDPTWLAVVWEELQPALSQLLGREIGPELEG